MHGWTKMRKLGRDGVQEADELLMAVTLHACKRQCTDAESGTLSSVPLRLSGVGPQGWDVRASTLGAQPCWDAIQYIAAIRLFCPMGSTIAAPRRLRGRPSRSVQYHFYRMRDNGLLDVA